MTYSLHQRRRASGLLRFHLFVRHVYCSDQAHSSVARTARTLGFRPDQVRVLPVDGEYRLQPAMLDAAREVNFSDMGVQLSRMARAFEVWISLRRRFDDRYDEDELEADNTARPGEAGEAGPVAADP